MQIYKIYKVKAVLFLPGPLEHFDAEYLAPPPIFASLE